MFACSVFCRDLRFNLLTSCNVAALAFGFPALLPRVVRSSPACLRVHRLPRCAINNVIAYASPPSSHFAALTRQLLAAAAPPPTFALLRRLLWQ
jgi:hypothetical protein